MNIEIGQDASPRDEDHWRWSVWIDGPDKDLNAIAEVIWELHPTFSPPTRRVTSRETNFKLKASGWGEFEIMANVHHKDGTIQVLRHWLRLEDRKESRSGRSKKPATPDLSVSERVKSLFLCYTLERSRLAGHLAKALRSEGFDVAMDIDVPTGEDFRRWSMERISRSDAVIAVGADELGPSLSPELHAAISAEVKIIPIVIGTSKRPALPPSLGNVAVIRLKEGDPELVAAELARSIRKRLS